MENGDEVCRMNITNRGNRERGVRHENKDREGTLFILFYPTLIRSSGLPGK